MKNSSRPSLIWCANCRDRAVSASRRAYWPPSPSRLAASTSTRSSSAACSSQFRSKASASRSWEAST
eukprot:122686-Alexandrium_andersonii.AAC.1